MAPYQLPPGEGRHYADNLSVVNGSTGTISFPIDHKGVLYGISAAATAGGTAGIAHRDAIEIGLTRDTNETLITKNQIATALIGPYDQMAFLVRPWRVSRNGVLKVPLKNVGTTTATIYVGLWLVEVDDGFDLDSWEAQQGY